MKILITGGAVGCNLDSVKIITNRFKGGRMVKLAEDIVLADESVRVTYLTSKGSVVPPKEASYLIKVVYHNGFEDYRQKVLELVPKHDAVILGAAVCNLIPMKPFKGKFPSHNYKVGDKIPIDFTIAPRVINEVKKVAPNTKLFGFKLLQGVKYEELINAAYDIVLESGAVAVFANDANNLDVKYAVTKEHGEIKFDKSHYDKWVNFIIDATKDKYYSTEVGYRDFELVNYRDAKKKIKNIIRNYSRFFNKQYGKKKYRFGTVAVRIGDSNFFVTTARGKREMSELVLVYGVDNRKRKVFADKKATLNAPLLYNIFKTHPQVKAIIHHHGETKFFKFDYAPPGTKRDSMRDICWFPKRITAPRGTEFGIRGHGTFKLLTADEVDVF